MYQYLAVFKSFPSPQIKMKPIDPRKSSAYHLYIADSDEIQTGTMKIHFSSPSSPCPVSSIPKTKTGPFAGDALAGGAFTKSS